MDPATLQFILLALQAAPSLINNGRDLLASIQGGLTPEQSAQLAAAQEVAHASLQAAVAAAVAEEQAADPVTQKGTLQGN